MTSTILRTEKMSKSFSDGGVQQHVIRNLDLEIKRGDFTIIMGGFRVWQIYAFVCLVGNGQTFVGKGLLWRERHIRLQQRCTCGISEGPCPRVERLLQPTYVGRNLYILACDGRRADYRDKWNVLCRKATVLWVPEWKNGIVVQYVYEPSLQEKGNCQRIALTRYKGCERVWVRDDPDNGIGYGSKIIHGFWFRT